MESPLRGCAHNTFLLPNYPDQTDTKTCLPSSRLQSFRCPSSRDPVVGSCARGFKRQQRPPQRDRHTRMGPHHKAPAGHNALPRVHAHERDGRHGDPATAAQHHVNDALATHSRPTRTVLPKTKGGIVQPTTRSTAKKRCQLRDTGCSDVNHSAAKGARHETATWHVPRHVPGMRLIFKPIHNNWLLSSLPGFAEGCGQ